MDGNRTHPGRLSSAPQTVLKTAGQTAATVHRYPPELKSRSQDSAAGGPYPGSSAALAVILAVLLFAPTGGGLIWILGDCVEEMTLYLPIEEGPFAACIHQTFMKVRWDTQIAVSQALYEHHIQP